MRVAAPIAASLIVRASGRTARVPIASLIEGPWRTGSKNPLTLRVERLAWDPIELRLLEPKTTFAPKQDVAIALGFNILTPESAEVAVRYSLELRPIGEPTAVAWRIARTQRHRADEQSDHSHPSLDRPFA